MNEKIFVILSVICLLECYANKNFRVETKASPKVRAQMEDDRFRRLYSGLGVQLNDRSSTRALIYVDRS